jgi:hypothetical protein
MDWEPPQFERHALARMWARVLRQLCDSSGCELAFTPSWISRTDWREIDDETFDPTDPDQMAAELDLFADQFGCRRVAWMDGSSYGMNDPQLLSWGYLRCPTDAIEKAFDHAGGPGAAGHAIRRGRAWQVVEWSQIRSVTDRLDAMLDSCLLLFEVLWHGEALAILSRHVDPDDVEAACQADDVQRIARRLRPRRHDQSGGEPFTGAPSWEAEGDD